MVLKNKEREAGVSNESTLTVTLSWWKWIEENKYVTLGLCCKDLFTQTRGMYGLKKLFLKIIPYMEDEERLMLYNGHRLFTLAFSHNKRGDLTHDALMTALHLQKKSWICMSVLKILEFTEGSMTEQNFNHNSILVDFKDSDLDPDNTDLTIKLINKE